MSTIQPAGGLMVARPNGAQVVVFALRLMNEELVVDAVVMFVVAACRCWLA
jgi:hypothetical protein